MTNINKGSVVRRFDRLTDVIEDHWPSEATFRLPSPRDGVPMVEIPLDLLERIVLTAIRDVAGPKVPR